MISRNEVNCWREAPVEEETFEWSLLRCSLREYVRGICFPPDSPSLPALDWQLPSTSGPYSLQIEVQPKSHHRAHYETEGSRGAVKAMAGGHPVVQVGCFEINQTP